MLMHGIMGKNCGTFQLSGVLEGSFMACVSDLRHASRGQNEA